MDYQLRVLSGEPTNGIFPLKPGDNVVGRSPDCAVVFESAGVSRQHFLIRVEGARATLENKGRFGTQVDDVAVEGSAELFPGSKIRFGMYMLIQFEEASAGGAGQADEAADPDKTAELPAFYKPVLPEPAAGPVADDSFFLRNDDVPLAQPASTRGGAPLPPPAKPKPAANVDPDYPESGFLPDTPPPKPASPPKRNRPQDGTDPSMLEFDSSFNRLRDEFARGNPAGTPPPARGDDELFSAPEALPSRPPPSSAGSRPAPPPPAPKAKPPPPAPAGDNDVHTRGLSPEAIAFMRQEWERKAKGRRTKTLAVVLLLALAGAAAAYTFYFR